MGFLSRLGLGGRRKRAVVLGLDGVPCTFLRKLLDDGVMPETAKIVAAGALLQMDATIPEISSVSWATFLTGANPARHGIFGFVDLRPSSYKIFFPSSRDLAAEPIWAAIGRSGRRAAILNVPGTYPAPEVPGVLVSGFVAVDLKIAVYPPSLLPKLESAGYRLDVDASRAKTDLDGFLKECRTVLERRIDAFDAIWKSEPWDLFIAVVTETDRLQHVLWPAAEDLRHPRRAEFLDLFRRIDDYVGSLASRLDEAATFFLVSDHGFTGIEREVYLNRWLAAEGYLKLAPSEKPTLESIEAGSRAFALDPSRIHLNLKGRFPLGCVEPGAAAEDLCREIAGKLAALAFEGRPVIRSVFRKGEIYSGPFAGRAPDLVALARPGFDLKGSLRPGAVFDRTHFAGMHTRDDACFLVRGRRVAGGRRPNIQDIAPTILDSLGLEIPQAMDGTSLLA